MDYEDFQENLEPVMEALDRHKSKIVLGALVVVAVLVYFFVIPHPGTLTVQVSELDGGGLNDAEVTVIDEGSGKTLATDLTSGGTAIFYNMPSHKTLSIEVSKGIAYQSTTATATIPSGQPQAVSVDLERRNSLSFARNEIPSTIPLGCADEFTVEVKNAGTDNFDTELLVEGEAAKLLSIPEARKTTYFNSSTNFSVRVLTPDEGSSELANAGGKIRIKKTNRSLPLNIKINPKIKLEVSPSEISITNSKPRQKITLRLFNSGQQAISGLSFRVNGDSDLRAACNQDIGSCISIEQLGGSLGKEILPQSALLVSLIVTPPQETGKTFLGSLEMSADCLRKSPAVVPIQIELPVV